MTIAPAGSPFSTFFYKVPRDGLTTEKGAFQIDVQNLVERLFVEVEEVALLDDAGIVHEDVDVAEFVEGRGHQIVNMQAIGDVAGGEPDLAQAFQVGNGGRAGLLVDVGDDDPGTFLKKTACYGQANAVGAAGDDCDLAVEGHGLSLIRFAASLFGGPLPS